MIDKITRDKYRIKCLRAAKRAYRKLLKYPATQSDDKYLNEHIKLCEKEIKELTPKIKA